MKKTLKIVLLILMTSFFSCKAQEKNIDKIIESKIKVDATFEKFDFSKLTRRLKSIKIVKQDEKSNNDSLHNTKDRLVRKSGILYSEYLELEDLKKGWFYIYKINSSNIQNKPKEISVRIIDIYEKWYEFNEKNEYTNTIDYDESFKNSIEYILESSIKYAKKYKYGQNISSQDEINAFLWWDQYCISILRSKNMNGDNYWNIFFRRPIYENEDSKNRERLYLKINDQTKEIKIQKHFNGEWTNVNNTIDFK